MRNAVRNAGRPAPRYINPGRLWHLTSDATALLRDGWDSRRSSDTLYGHGMAVSNCPDEWIEIAELGGSDVVSVQLPPGAKVLDLYATFESVNPDEIPAVREWSIQQGLTKPSQAWRIDYTDNEEDGEEVERYMVFNTEAEALAEAADQEGAIITGPLDSIVGVQKQNGHGWGQDLLRSYVAANYPDVAVVWYADRLDPVILSAPQGYVIPGWERRVKLRLSAN